MTVSIGVARGHAGHGVTELLRNADVAMYVAKRHRKGRFMLFEPQMHAAVRDRLSLESDLRHAIDAKQFTLRYQPIFRLDDGQLAGVEALVRWEHPKRGHLAPAEFIPLAEDSGLIIPLGRLVLAAACRDAARWLSSRPHGPPFSLAVNVSGRQLKATLAADVAAALEESGLPPDRLLLEITESVVMRDSEATLARLHALKALGVRLAIDDFGTGYSSLAYLQRFPIDVLKIDRSFVERVSTNQQDASLARTIVALGGALSLQTVAEGVERQDQVDALRAMGCDLAQGYLFSRPMSVEDIGHLMGRVAGTVSPAVAA